MVLPNMSQLLLVCSLVCIQAKAEPDSAPLRLIGITAHQPISEMSGMVKSRRFPDVYWVHNDSGDTPRLFAINRSGEVIITNYLKPRFHGAITEEGKKPWPGIPIHLAVNEDWEDIAIDEDRIYIADLGNNGNARRDLGVYILYEPNPHAVYESRIINYIPVRYPLQEQYPALKWHYDSEGMFVVDGKMYFLTKHRQPNKPFEWAPGVTLFRLDTFNTNEANILTEVDHHEQVSVVTGADVSPDGSKLAIVSYSALWIFEKPTNGDHWLSGNSKVLPLDYRVTQQIEAVCWDDDDTLLVSNEQREIYEVKLSDIPDSNLHK
jgi:hypothetical protein